MIEQFRISKIVKKSESPFILTFNDKFQLIGDKGRALEGYVEKGMRIQAEGHMNKGDFLIEGIHFPDGVVLGRQSNVYY
jgi:isopenicillin N synthase-like dioxygenase